MCEYATYGCERYDEGLSCWIRWSPEYPTYPTADLAKNIARWCASKTRIVRIDHKVTICEGDEQWLNVSNI